MAVYMKEYVVSDRFENLSFNKDDHQNLEMNKNNLHGFLRRLVQINTCWYLVSKSGTWAVGEGH